MLLKKEGLCPLGQTSLFIQKPLTKKVKTTVTLSWSLNNNFPSVFFNAFLSRINSCLERNNSSYVFLVLLKCLCLRYRWSARDFRQKFRIKYLFSNTNLKQTLCSILISRNRGAHVGSNHFTGSLKKKLAGGLNENLCNLCVHRWHFLCRFGFGQTFLRTS